MFNKLLLSLVTQKMQIPYSTDKDPESFFQREEFSECILEAPRILQFDPESWA